MINSRDNADRRCVERNLSSSVSTDSGLLVFPTAALFELTPQAN